MDQIINFFLPEMKVNFFQLKDFLLDDIVTVERFIPSKIKSITEIEAELCEPACVTIPLSEAKEVLSSLDNIICKIQYRVTSQDNGLILMLKNNDGNCGLPTHFFLLSADGTYMYPTDSTMKTKDKRFMPCFYFPDPEQIKKLLCK